MQDYGSYLALGYLAQVQREVRLRTYIPAGTHRNYSLILLARRKSEGEATNGKIRCPTDASIWIPFGVTTWVTNHIEWSKVRVVEVS